MTITSQTGALGARQAGGSRVERAAIGLVDAGAALAENARAYQEIVAAAQAVIDRIPQPRYREILTLRYICGYSFKSISDECRYTDPNSVYRAHGWALAEAQKILNDMEVEDD